jgi:anti-sigma factor (TIGR02949 family)
MSCGNTQELLSAFVDGELSPRQATEVAEHLAMCEACSHEYDMVLKTVQILRAELAPSPAPDVLRARIQSTLREQPPARLSVVRPEPSIPWRAIAAVLMIAVSSSALTWIVTNRRSAEPELRDEVLASHIRSLMPDHLTDVRSNDQHNVKPWFNGRLDFSPAVPRLDDAGFPLIGGRLDYVHNRPVAVVVYARRQHLINVYAWPTDASTELASSLSSRQGYNVLHWRHAGVEQWVVSDLNPPELQQFAALLRSGGAPAGSKLDPNLLPNEHRSR